MNHQAVRNIHFCLVYHLVQSRIKVSLTWMVGVEYIERGVANGHYEFPYEPQLEGQEEWLKALPEREILHALPLGALKR